MELDFNNNNNNSFNSGCNKYLTANYNLTASNMITSSTSQIFATANSFSPNQRDNVFYSRETIHLLAKFLSLNSPNTIFRSIYSYAPDNLAWLWAFLDWDMQIDLGRVATQDHYQPFSVQSEGLRDDDIKLINRMFAEAPLIKNPYCEKISISDVYQIIEHVNKIQVASVAKSLFLLYFPRFEKYMDNPLRQFTRVCILKSNLSRIKHMDEIVRTLIKTRYTNLEEYKSKIQSCSNLPSYLQTLLFERNYYNIQQQQQQSIKSPRWYNQTYWDSATSNMLTGGRQVASRQQQSPTSGYMLHNQKTISDFCGLNDMIAQNNGGTATATTTTAMPTVPLSPKDYNLQSPKAKFNFAQLPSPRTPTHTFNFNPIQTQQTTSANTVNNSDQIWSTNVDNATTVMPTSPTNMYHAHVPAKTQSTSSSSTTSSSTTANEYHNLLQDQNNVTAPSFEEELVKYMRHSAFISSPMTNRFTCLTNKSNGVGGNGDNVWKQFNGSNNLISFSDYAQPLTTTTTTRVRHNSNIDHNSSYFCSPLGTSYATCVGTNDVFYNNDLISPNGSCSSNGGGNLFVKTISQQHQHHLVQAKQVWCGRLPPKIYPENSIYSRKVFLGGLPWDVDHNCLLSLLHKYGTVKFDVPGNDQKHPRKSKINERSTPGYIYVTYEHESSVQKMLADCRKDFKNGGEHYFYSIPSTFLPQVQQQVNPFGGHMQQQGKRMGKMKEVEVIPWNQEDISYVPKKNLSPLPPKIDSRSTIFVGALHGMLTAQGLAKIMTELFGEVIHAGLDTDKFKYPIGSGRVTFRDRQSYMKAIKTQYVNIKANMTSADPSPKFEKRIQMDPYLEDAKCCKCDLRSTVFCRNEFCLDYYCSSCELYRHDRRGADEHVTMSRQNKPNNG